MSVVEEMKIVAERMALEQQDLERSLKQNTVVTVSDDTVDGVERLIYNHCLNKTQLAKALNITKNTLDRRLNEMKEEGLFHGPIIQNKSHLFPRNQIMQIFDYCGISTFRDKYNPTVMSFQNQKGGTGKSTTCITMAEACALDLNLNAKIVVIDLDPQGSLAAMLVKLSSLTDDNDEEPENIFLTTIDILLNEFEPDGLCHQLLSNGNSLEDIILNTPLSTHLPNLDIISAFPDDERFTDYYWQLDEDERKQLLLKLSEEIIPVLKQKYDLIIFDTPPVDNPLVWSVNAATECVVIPVTPDENDFASTANYLKTLPARLSMYSNKVKWWKVLPVNVDENSSAQQDTIDKILRTVQDKMMTCSLTHSELFKQAAKMKRTVLDVRKSEEACPSRQFDLAVTSTKAVYSQLITEIKQVALRG